MKPSILIASVALLVFTLQCHAQEPQAQTPAPAAQPAATPLNQITVNLLGQFNNPQRVNLPKGSGLLDALAAAGGLSRIADAHKAVIIHKTASGKPDSVKIDLIPIMTGRAKDIVLKNGDTVVVSQSYF
jgi:protein involved in polysaccharide export with SLBB domain